MLKIHLLGPFQVFQGAKALAHFDTDKTRALLAYLAAENAAPQRRDVLAGLLWPDYPNPAALRNLRLTIFRLRQALADGAQPPADLPLLELPNRQVLQFNLRSAAWVDLHEFETLLAHCSHHLHTSLLQCQPCIDQLNQAVSLYRGSFLDGFSLKDSYAFEEWLVIRREHLHQQMLEALEQLSSHYLWKAEYADSFEERKDALQHVRQYTRRALQLEPCRESAHRQLIQALAMAGQTQEALAQFQACRQVLEKEFGIQPDPATVQLYQQIRGKTFDTRPLHPVTFQVAPQPRHNLPPTLTPLLGRQPQLERLKTLLSAYRWVTLVGEGGIGKTRLALAAAEQALAQFPDGAWYVPLAEASPDIPGHPEEMHRLLAQAIANVLHVSLEERISPADQLFEALRPKKLLLVLDSIERFSSGADLIIDLIVNAPGLCVITTSRQFLHFQAGYVMRVDGLPVPEQDGDPQGAQSASVQLFAERVERLAGECQLDERSLPHVIHICRLLNGIPLAIELAAPWATRLPLEAISHAIQTDLDFLSTSMAGIPERHRSMRAVFESSWSLIAVREQQVLARGAHLPSNFTYDDALAASQATPREVENLVDKFLITRLSPGRYRIHDTLRQFAAEKLVLVEQAAANRPLL